MTYTVLSGTLNSTIPYHTSLTAAAAVAKTLSLPDVAENAVFCYDTCQAVYDNIQNILINFVALTIISPQLQLRTNEGVECTVVHVCTVI